VNAARRTARRIAVTLVLVLPLAPVMPTVAVAQDADSTSSARPLFTYRDAILAGAFAVTARLVHPLDERFRDRLQDSSTQANRKLQALATFVRTTATPGSYIIGTSMYAAGRLAKNRKLEPTVKAVCGDQVVTLNAVALKAANQYKAVFALPAAGEWIITVDSRYCETRMKPLVVTAVAEKSTRS